MIPTKTSKEIAIYLHDAIGFIPMMFPKQDQPKELAKLENERWVSVDVLRQKLQQRINELDKTIGITKSFADSRIEELEQLLVMF